MYREETPPLRRLPRWLPGVLVAGSIALVACDAGDTTAPSAGDPAAATPAPASPQLLCRGCPGTTRMAHSRWMGSTRDIYLKNEKGSANSWVTTSPAADEYEPAWSPDYTRLVFTRNTKGLRGQTGGLWVTDVYGYGTQITSFWGDRGASWGKTGKIAFYSFRDTGVSQLNEIYTINPDGTGLMRLTKNVGDDRNPAWSPNGSKIAFASDGGVPLGHLHLFLMNPDGSGVQQLTFGTHEDQPAWSPDGNRIAFFGNNGSYPAVYVMNADGTNIKELVKGIGPAPYGGTQLYFVGQPTWSPDGKKIAFTSDVSGHHEIFTINADGSDLQDITHGDAVDNDPAWSY